MGMFTHGIITESVEKVFSDPDAIYSQIIEMEVSQLPDEKIQEFCAPGGVGETLVAEGKLGKRTLVRLSKKDDITRRKKMIALNLAKENNDPLWDKLALNRVKERELIAKIVAKYGNKSQKLAVQAQKDFVKKSHLPASFMRAGGDDRLSNESKDK